MWKYYQSIPEGRDATMIQIYNRMAEKKKNEGVAMTSQYQPDRHAVAGLLERCTQTKALKLQWLEARLLKSGLKFK